MKNQSFKFALIALLLGGSAAVAGTFARPFANNKWGLNRTTGLYINVTSAAPGTYDCSGSSGICTAEFPTDVNPNDQANDSHPGTVQPLNIVAGEFEQ